MKAAVFYARADLAPSRELLRRAAAEHTGAAAESFEILVNEWGRPFFVAGPEFSVSHSGEYWACAFAEGRVGLDLQLRRMKSPPEKIAARFFHPLEVKWLEENGYERFFDVWSAKESYVKLTGRGFRGDTAGFSVVSERGEFPYLEGCGFALRSFMEEYSLCLCVRGGAELELHRMKEAVL